MDLATARLALGEAQAAADQVIRRFPGSPSPLLRGW
jgi:hypothetical protein